MRKDIEDRGPWIAKVHRAARQTWEEVGEDALAIEDDQLGAGVVMLDREEVFLFILDADRIEERLHRLSAWTEEDDDLWNSLTHEEKCGVLFPAFPYEEYGY